MASQAGALDIGYKAGLSGVPKNAKLLYLLGAVSVCVRTYICTCVDVSSPYTPHAICLDFLSLSLLRTQA